MLNRLTKMLSGLTLKESRNINSQVPLCFQIKDVKHIQCTEILPGNVNRDNLMLMYSSCHSV